MARQVERNQIARNIHNLRVSSPPKEGGPNDSTNHYLQEKCRNCLSVDSNTIHCYCLSIPSGNSPFQIEVKEVAPGCNFFG